MRLRALLSILVLACASPAAERRPDAPKPAPAPAPEPQAQAQAPQPEAAPAPAGPDRSRVPAAQPPPALDVPAQQHFQLSNGLRVRLVEYNRLPIVALHLVVDAGGIHDPEEQPGLASFTAAMMTEGTKKRSATRISDDLGYLGASLSAGAGFDQASLSGSGLSRHLDALLELFADVLRNPTFPESDFARLKDQRIVALVQQRDQPGAVAAKAFAQAYWGDHPYGHWLLGTEQSLRGMRREDLARYHAAWWKPARAELVVVGDVMGRELKQKLERALAGWKGAPPPARAAPRPPQREPRTVLVEKRGAPQAYLLLGMPGYERASLDYAAGEVAFQVLGGGSASRLFRNLREEKGYTYGVYARGEARRLGGATIIAGSVKADVTGKALEALLDEVRRLREEPVSDEELDSAKNALVLSLPGDFSTAGGIAAKIAEEVVYGLPDDYWSQYAEAVMGIGSFEVQRIAEQYLDPARLTAVMVAEPQVVKPQLADLPLGEVDVRPAAAVDGAPRPAAAPAKKKRPARAEPRAEAPR